MFEKKEKNLYTQYTSPIPHYPYSTKCYYNTRTHTVLRPIT